MSLKQMFKRFFGNFVTDLKAAEKREADFYEARKGFNKRKQEVLEGMRKTAQTRTSVPCKHDAKVEDDLSNPMHPLSPFNPAYQSSVTDSSSSTSYCHSSSFDWGSSSSSSSSSDCGSSSSSSSSSDW